MRVVVVTPTYNEADNIDTFLDRVRAAVPSAHVVVVDDASPDGTGDKVRTRSERDPLIRLMARSGPRGYAAASREALTTLAAVGDADVIVTMDADLSHAPESIPALVAAIEGGADVAVGSRYVAGGGIVNWPLHRRLLSRWGNLYTAAMLKVKIRDCTSGFRAYRAATLRDSDVGSTTANGYAFLTELAWLLSRRNGSRIVEVPITYVDRTLGQSKMNLSIVRESMWLVTTWGVALRLRGTFRR